MPSHRNAGTHTRKHHRKSVSAPERYRLLITWPGHQSPTHFHTSDLAQARGIARRNAANGAHVTFQENQGWGRFTTTRTYQPATETR